MPCLCVSAGYILIWNAVLSISWRKNGKIFPCEAFLLYVVKEIREIFQICISVPLTFHPNLHPCTWFLQIYPFTHESFVSYNFEWEILNSNFKIDEISTNFPREISMLNRWRIDEDVSIGNAQLFINCMRKTNQWQVTLGIFNT